MADIFEHHGLTHLSASQLILYSAEPALWVPPYPFDHKDPLSHSATRGNSAEQGTTHGL